MKARGDDPINPVVPQDRRETEWQGNPHGLTKREHFAGLIMAAMMARFADVDVAPVAVDAADALLEALNGGRK